MNDARDAAHEIRDRFGYATIARFPVHGVAASYGVVIERDVDNECRVKIASRLGTYLKVDDCDAFARHLLAPLYLVEPMCAYGRVKTGRRRFFGLFEVTRGYTTQELASTFDVPEWMMTAQLQRLL